MKFKQLHVLALVSILSLTGCGDEGSNAETTVITSAQSSQTQGVADPVAGDEDCNGETWNDCQVDCPDSGGFSYRLVCGPTEAPLDIGPSGTAETEETLPVLCRLRPLCEPK